MGGALDRLKLAENTLVIVTSDNGGVLISDGGTRPEAKAYDAGMRVSGSWRGRNPAETADVSAKHPEVVKALASLLDRYRDGGYSRELPPVAAKPASTVTLPAPTTKAVLNDPLDKVPAAPWVLVRGQWTARDGAVRASQKAGEQGPAALTIKDLAARLPSRISSDLQPRHNHAIFSP